LLETKMFKNLKAKLRSRIHLKLLGIIIPILAIPITLILVFRSQDTRSSAAAPDKLETEAGTLSSSGVTKKSDSGASGGSYVLFNKKNQPTTTPFPADDYPAEAKLQAISPPYPNGHLNYLQVYSQPEWEAQAIRVGDEQNMSNFYSTMQPWSKDGNYLLLNKSGKHIVDGHTYEKLGKYGSSSPGSYPRWSNTEPHRLYKTVNSPGAILYSDGPPWNWSTWVTLPEGWTHVSIGADSKNENDGGSQGDISLNDRILLTGQYYGSPAVMVYDLKNKKIISTVTTGLEGYSPGDPNAWYDAGDISWDGNYFVVIFDWGNGDGTNYGQGTWLFNANTGEVIRQVFVTHWHGDFARDLEGNEVYVYLYPPGLNMHNLETGERTTLLTDAEGASTMGHASGTSYDDPGWILGGTQRNEVGIPGNQQIFSVKLDGSKKVRVYGWHNNYPADGVRDYSNENHPALSRDGKRAVFQTTFSSNGSPVYGYILGKSVLP
jgi:hypothetical protein